MPWVKVDPVFDPKIIGLCGTPYHGHKRGCHNFCKRPSCPPTMLPLSICLDDCYFVYIKFAIGEHVARMAERHPEWSIQQCRNILYWQAGARKILNKEVDRFLEEYPEYHMLGRQDHLDSYGIDMRATMKAVGINLKYGPDWATHKWTYLLRYGGIPIEEAGVLRLKKLRKKYPAVYDLRPGRCDGCTYRPCLKFLRGNPNLYAKKKIGCLLVERFLQDRGLLVRCNCGKAKIIATTKPICTHPCFGKKH